MVKNVLYFFRYMSNDNIVIRGAREHNLKNIDVTLPRNSLIVFTGLSGSGKSSLAFDTIYAEGQRRYMESLSSYARQFLGQMEKPDVDGIDGLSPAISIDQKSTSHNPRSTVGTITEINDYLRLLFARIGVPHCPVCGRVITRQPTEQIVDTILNYPENSKILILAPVVRGRKGEYHQLLYDLYHGGFARVRVNGEIRSLSDSIQLDRYKAHTIDVVIDRLTIGHVLMSRVQDAVEQAIKITKGLITIVNEDTYEEVIMSQQLACPNDGTSLAELTPRSFSFNSPFGACETCDGLGFIRKLDAALIVPDKTKSIEEGAIMPWHYKTNNYYGSVIRSVAYHYGIPTNKPIHSIDSKKLAQLFEGPEQPVLIPATYMSSTGPKRFTIRFQGLLKHLEKRYHETDSDAIRSDIERYMSASTCETCHGQRLKQESLLVTIEGKNIAELSAVTIEEALQWFKQLKLSDKDLQIALQILMEITNRLEFLYNVGLNYLTLSRSAATLSGGEGQRIRLASQIGSALTGVLYVLDEPTIGLHQRDNLRLIDTLRTLKERGNTVIVVEHDEDTIRNADYVVDIGPGAGEHGGSVVAAQPIEEFLANETSLTARYISGLEKIALPSKRREYKPKHEVTVSHARENNLKNITAHFPIGLMTCITGVSGSGKSTLVNEILHKGLTNKINRTNHPMGKHESISGDGDIERVIVIDQSPIGRTPRSNPATYTKVFDHVRDIFSRTPEAKVRGYKPGRFSFNVDGGRCDNCRGDGVIRIEMHFLADVEIPCEICKGTRYNRETLEVRYKSKNIAQVLDMTVDEGVEFFTNIPVIHDTLTTLQAVGLGYIRLGQSATTLSGGEAQRVKLASELGKRTYGKTLYILDEPTTGLHFADIKKLLDVLNRLVNKGNTVVIIEHNLDVIKNADWIIDLGPEGGARGGQVIATGTPEDVAQNSASYTGHFLKSYLAREGHDRKLATVA
jgi:excinuclease ABC subunit A